MPRLKISKNKLRNAIRDFVELEYEEGIKGIVGFLKSKNRPVVTILNYLYIFKQYMIMATPAVNDHPDLLRKCLQHQEHKASHS